MEFKNRTLTQLANMICGNGTVDEPNFFRYRSSSFLTEFFHDCGTAYTHRGESRAKWVAGVLADILRASPPSSTLPPEAFARVIRTLMDQGDANGESPDRESALQTLNGALAREGFEAFYGDDKQCYLKHLPTNTIVMPGLNPHRPFTPAEVEKRRSLESYLDHASEDELIEEILLPLFRQLGYYRVTAAGHRDKALEYGKDVWMKYTLPTQHVIYFGIQAKRSKIDASAASEANISEIYNQVNMMLGHEIFDPETGRRVLVDHAFIVAGGEITKAARNWLGGKLDASKRSQVMFMDREDILNLYVVTGLPLPSGASPPPIDDGLGDLPF